jgi:uncharacterized metal-binding protein
MIRFLWLPLRVLRFQYVRHRRLHTKAVMTNPIVKYISLLFILTIAIKQSVN